MNKSASFMYTTVDTYFNATEVDKWWALLCFVSSSPLHRPGRLKILFNVLELSAGDGRHSDRRGVCTGWLSDLTLPMLPAETTPEMLMSTDKPIMVQLLMSCLWTEHTMHG